MGLGHVSRMATLADGVRRAHGEVTFAVQSRDTVAIELLLGRGFDVRPVEADAGTDADAGETAATASRCGAVIVVVDGYQFGEAYLRALHGKRLFVGYVDDLFAEVATCDLVLNNNVFADRAFYPPTLAAQLLLGPRYALLGQAFVAARRPLHPGRAERLLVTLGGSDPTGQTTKVLQALGMVALSPIPLDVRVVVGRANGRPIVEAIERAAIESAHAVTVLRDVKDMAQQMAWADMAITAGGTTCLEISCVGVPSLVVAVADNQRRVASGFAGRGLMRSLGWHADLGVGRIAQELTALRADEAGRAAMVDAQHSLIDGRGTERTVAALYGAYAAVRTSA